MVYGKYFTNASGVEIGNVSCRSFEVISDSEVTCVVPEVVRTMTSGFLYPMTVASAPMSVTVANSFGRSANNSMFSYSFQDKSYVGGGSYMDIKGTDIVLGSKVLIGGEECMNVRVSSSTLINCTSPALGTGEHQVEIVSPPEAVGDIQNWTGCSVINTPDYSVSEWWKDPQYTVVLNDARDGKDYRVRKMPDGNCWMIDNLKLGTPGTELVLTSTDSDVVADFTLPANPVNLDTHRANGICVGNENGITGSGYPLTCDGTSDGTTGIPANTNYNYVAYTDLAYIRELVFVNDALFDNCNGLNKVSPDSLTGCGYGYNWHTATAGTGSYGLVDQDAVSSICPVGWRLPLHSSNEFGVLNNAMATGDSSVSSSENSVVTRHNWWYNGAFEGALAGAYTSGIWDGGRDGRYWTASASNETGAYQLDFGDDRVNPDSVGSKTAGIPVRCILR